MTAIPDACFKYIWVSQTKGIFIGVAITLIVLFCMGIILKVIPPRNRQKK